MKILDRYFITGFLRPFGACLLIFTVLVFMGRFFDKMDIFNSFHARIGDIIVYLILGLPYWLNLVLPVATLLSLLFSLGQFQQRGEITAARSAGISTARLFSPFFGLGLAISLFSLIGGLTFLPKSNFQARTLYRVSIKKRQALDYRKDHVVVAGRDRRRYTIGWLDVDNNQMRDVVVDRFGDNVQRLETITAGEALYQNGRWIFKDGSFRRYDPTHPDMFFQETFAQRVVNIPDKPKDFVFEDKPPEDMTGIEIVQRIDRQRRSGIAAYKEKVALHLKLALPFANMVVVALGIPFALRTGQRGRTQTVAYALGVAFFYWGMTSICQSFGEQGRIPAWMAAWVSNVVFSFLALWLIRRAT